MAKKMAKDCTCGAGGKKAPAGGKKFDPSIFQKKGAAKKAASKAPPKASGKKKAV